MRAGNSRLNAVCGVGQTDRGNERERERDNELDLSSSLGSDTY